ncbi:hypothetical protein BJF79_37590 [Actinomadura sp. CNU-125]|nr:hypothetical protein BJF79_37590 [Actinomadura sp. CNU-125]
MVAAVEGVLVGVVVRAAGADPGGRSGLASQSVAIATASATPSRGAGWSSMPSGVNSRSPDAIADGASGSAPSA